MERPETSASGSTENSDDVVLAQGEAEGAGRRKRRWSSDEDAFLCEFAKRLKLSPDTILPASVNERAAAELLGALGARRSHESVKKRLQKVVRGVIRAQGTVSSIAETSRASDPAGRSPSAEHVLSGALRRAAAGRGPLSEDEVRSALRGDVGLLLERVKSECNAQGRAGARPRTRTRGGRERIRIGTAVRTLLGNKDARRKQMFSKHQSLFHKSKKRLWSHLVNGDPKYLGDLKSLANHWRPVFESTEEMGDPEPLFVRPTVGDIFYGVKNEEIIDTLRQQSGTSPGPDGVRADALLASVPVGVLKALLNGLIIRGTLPVELKKSRTVFIVKGKESTSDPSQMRPISMTSALVRLFHGILARRLRDRLVLHPTQTGFVPIDGCAINTLVLERAIRSAQEGPVSLALLDVRKAFDSVRHESLLRAAKSFGVASRVIEYLRDYYREAVTVLQCKGEVSDEIKLTRGVRQGDPLSPLLFNMVVDELLELTPGCGIPLHRDSPWVKTLAFADDLVLFAQEPAGLQRAVDAAQEWYKKRGMTLNPAKTVCLANLWNGKRKVSVWRSNGFLRVAGEIVRPSGVGDINKYLGVRFGTGGKIAMGEARVKDMLAALKRAKLRPNQKMLMLRDYLVPSLMHELVLGKVVKTQLERIDGLIRKFVKAVLHLPHDACDTMIYMHLWRGGLGIPRLAARVPVYALDRIDRVGDRGELGKTLSQSETYKAEKARLMALVSSYEWYTDWPVMKWVSNPRMRKHLFGVLEASRSPSYVREYGQYTNHLNVGNRWLSGTGPFTGSAYVRAVKLRYELLACAASATRGRAGAKFCRYAACMRPGGVRPVENLDHILGTCVQTRGLAISRHDKVLRMVSTMIADRARTAGKRVEVVVEPIIDCSGERLKPDLVVVMKEWAAVLDVTVAGSGRLEAAYDHKENKYDREEVKEWVAEMAFEAEGLRYEDGEPRVECHGLVFGNRGSIYGKSMDVMVKLGLTKADMNNLVHTVIYESLSMYSAFNAGLRGGSSRL